jgi:hypothetical protein
LLDATVTSPRQDGSAGEDGFFLSSSTKYRITRTTRQTAIDQPSTETRKKRGSRVLENHP